MAQHNTEFVFYLPTRVVFGSTALDQLVGALKELPAWRVLVVTDPGIIRAGLLEPLTRRLEKQGIAYEIFSEVEPNPKDYQVRHGAQNAEAFGAQALVALGGGSPIDCAKAMGVLMAHHTRDLARFYGKDAVYQPSPPLFTVPTTAGTGSEVTFSSVITDTSEKSKFTIKSPLLAPRAAFMDPGLTAGMPPDLTAYTGMDALTHAVEAYTAKAANPFSDLFALRAAALIGTHLYRAFHCGSDPEARAGMLLSSLLGGMAFSQSDVASVHCLAESLGSVSDAPHGACNAVLLPYVMEFNMPCCVQKYADIARALGVSFNGEEEGARAAVVVTREMARELRLPPLKQLGIKEESLPKAAELSTGNISTKSNPRPMGREDYLDILKKAYGS